MSSKRVLFGFLFLLTACGGGGGADAGPDPDAGAGEDAWPPSPCRVRCPSSRPVCDETTRSCVECTDNTHCGGSTPVCDLVTGRCGGCLDDSHCADGTQCDTAAEQCVYCLADDDCDEGSTCVDGACDRECGLPVIPSTAPLCAPGACVGTELHLDGPHFRNGAPAISVSPDGAEVLYATAEGGYGADLVSPGSTPERLGFAVARGSVFHADTTWALTDDGAFGVRLRRRAGTEWELIAGREGHVEDHALAVDDAACVHAAYRSNIDGQSHYARWTGAGWVDRALPGEHGYQERVALASDGTPHVAWMRSGPGPASVGWQAGDAAVETAPGTESGLIADFWMTLLADQPHILVGGGVFEEPGVIGYAWRTDAGWQDLRFGENRLESCPTAYDAGERCETESVSLHALDIVSDGLDSVRILVGEVTEHADLTSVCPSSPGDAPLGCMWNGPLTYTGRILVGEPREDGTVDLQPVSGVTVPATVGGAVVAADGTIHLATYGPGDTDNEAGGGGSEVHYIAISPGS